MEYVGKITDLISKHGGRYLVQGAEPELVSGNSEIPGHVVVLEFPSKDSARAFLEERSELGLADLFLRATNSRVLLADGVEDNGE